MRYISPLRYPGGKARLAPYLRRIIESQSPQPRQYAEPFAGGAGAALQLLFDGVVEKIHLNDLNPGIAAFWRASLDYPDEFCCKIQSVDLSIDEWCKQRQIYLAPSGQDDMALGFATFYLNRTNRSGILDARPMGGFEQLGKWKIGARFNRDGLCDRVQKIANMRHLIYVTDCDALDFLFHIKETAKDVFVYADPPYLIQGDGLYMHAFDGQDHVDLANFLSSANFPWLITYDDDPRITNILYGTDRCATFDISHTANRQHIGRESVIYAEGLVVPDLEITLGRSGRWVRTPLSDKTF